MLTTEEQLVECHAIIEKMKARFVIFYDLVAMYAEILKKLTPYVTDPNLTDEQVGSLIRELFKTENLELTRVQVAGGDITEDDKIVSDKEIKIAGTEEVKPAAPAKKKRGRPKKNLENKV